MSAPYASRCYSCTSLMAAPCTEWHIYICCSTACSSVVSAALWRFFRRCSATSRSAFAVAGALTHPLCCALVQCTVASYSASVSSADSHSELPSSKYARQHSAGA